MPVAELLFVDDRKKKKKLGIGCDAPIPLVNRFEHEDVPLNMAEIHWHHTHWLVFAAKMPCLLVTPVNDTRCLRFDTKSVCESPEQA